MFFSSFYSIITRDIYIYINEFLSFLIQSELLLNKYKHVIYTSVFITLQNLKIWNYFCTTHFIDNFIDNCFMFENRKSRNWLFQNFDFLFNFSLLIICVTSLMNWTELNIQLCRWRNAECKNGLHWFAYIFMQHSDNLYCNFLQYHRIIVFLSRAPPGRVNFNWRILLNFQFYLNLLN